MLHPATVVVLPENTKSGLILFIYSVIWNAHTRKESCSTIDD